MHRDKPISDSHEMYLKALYEVRGEHDVARVRDLASTLGVSPATVSSVLKKLENLRLVEHERYGGVTLTDTGARVAECVIDRFETLRDVLVEVFGVTSDVAEVDACEMEHGVSPTTVRHMQALLKNVRGGRIQLPKRRAKRDQACPECEAIGICRAAQLE
ncbi:MAG: metal-dependent transcriptional regulator [Acidobacteriota bacterium]